MVYTPIDKEEEGDPLKNIREEWKENGRNFDDCVQENVDLIFTNLVKRINDYLINNVKKIKNVNDSDYRQEFNLAHEDYNLPSRFKAKKILKRASKQVLLKLNRKYDSKFTIKIEHSEYNDMDCCCYVCCDCYSEGDEIKSIYYNFYPLQESTLCRKHCVCFCAKYGSSKERGGCCTIL